MNTMATKQIQVDKKDIKYEVYNKIKKKKTALCKAFLTRKKIRIIFKTRHAS